MSYGQQPGQGRSGLDRPAHDPAGPAPALPGYDPWPPHAGPAQRRPPYAPPAQGVDPRRAHQGYPRPQQPYRPYEPYVPPTRPDAPPHGDPYGDPYGRSEGHGPAYTPPPRATRRRPPIPTGGPVTDEDERWAVPAYIGLFVTGFIAPAIVYLVKGRSSPFARFHAVQALNLFIVTSAGNLAGLLLIYLAGMAGLLIALVFLAGGCFCVIKAAIGANRCEWYRLPAIVAWPIVR